ncbi:ribonuclease H-like domain-containing protein [Haloferacaceae archaeon DSL9]
MRIENSFIPVRGVGEATERKLWAAGATHWDDFEPSLVGEKTGDRIESFIREGRSRLRRGDAHFFDVAFPSSERWRLYENFRETACFFDIETTGLDAARHDVTTLSYYCGDETTTLVRGDDLTADTVRDAFEGVDLLVSFNGIRFDEPFLEEAFDVDIDVPHLDLMYPCKQLGLSGGLKRIEREIGIERDRPDISGRDAVRLWREYERGDDAALDTLVSYNREDAVNLETLAERVAGTLHENIFASSCGAPQA